MFNKCAILAVLTAVCALLAACAGNQAAAPLAPPPVASAGKGMIYVYWPPAPIDYVLPDIVPEEVKKIGRWNILVNDKTAGALKRGEYAAIEVAPGKHYVKRQMPMDIVGQLLDLKGELVHATAGSAHFFELRQEDQYYVAMIERSASAGREAIASLKLTAAPVIAATQ